jgi:Zn finger protein HypA/HybF involved in hydrogenase expression
MLLPDAPRVGDYVLVAGVMPDSLIIAFDASKDNTLAKNAKLILESAPIGGV